MHAILHALYVELVLEVEFNIYTQLLYVELASRSSWWASLREQ
jgi:hypothetical protein